MYTAESTALPGRVGLQLHTLTAGRQAVRSAPPSPSPRRPRPGGRHRRSLYPWTPAGHVTTAGAGAGAGAGISSAEHRRARRVPKLCIDVYTRLASVPRDFPTAAALDPRRAPPHGSFARTIGRWCRTRTWAFPAG